MPNHVTNIIHIDDNPREVFEFIKCENEPIGSFDFNKLIPMPEELNIESSSTQSQGLAIAKYRNGDSEDINKMLEYEWVKEKGITTPEELITELLSREYNSDMIELGEKAYNNIIKYGHPDWWHWCVENFGTKWNAYEFVYKGDEVTDEIEFFTAWSPPIPVIEALSKKFPDRVIKLSWSDEDFGSNVGEITFQNGEIIEHNEPESQSKEAFEMAAEIQGCDLKEWGYVLSADGCSYEYVQDEPEISNEKIRVVLVRPMQKPEIVEIGSDLKSMQHTVRGMIEAIYPYEEQVALVCNMEGKNLQLPLNRAIKDEDGEITDIIAGDFFIADCSGENFGSLSDEQLELYSEMFKSPEMFYKSDGEIKVVPIMEH
jgi:hypothetical protein